MTLVDTSVWIEHLRRREPTLMATLDAEQVLMHLFVLGEMDCGHLTRRSDVLTLMRNLPNALMATDRRLLQSNRRRWFQYVRCAGPKAENKKLLVSVRYSPEVLAYFKSTDEGWQSRMDGVLREYVARHSRRA